jgi:hypothetical protein
MPLSGVATGTLDLDLPEDVNASAGNVDLEIAGLTLGDGKNKMKVPGMAGGLTLDAIDAGKLKPANETRMIQRATGVHHTVVNGEVVIENGAATGAYPGRVLRPARWKD